MIRNKSGRPWVKVCRNKTAGLFFVFVLILSVLAKGPSHYYGFDNMSTRVVLTKTAQFQGFLVRNPQSHIGGWNPPAPPVEIFKGIPYANPPVDSLRYESPSSYPFNNSEVYSANVIKSPCPRFGNESAMTFKDRDSIRGLKKIKNMEDCLYLDIYAPMRTVKDPSLPALPVLVIANSQQDDPKDDPFDGSSMAAIGNLIVITFRYRVGVLGFLYPGYSSDVRSNFGLWDQLAALQWIRENVNYFGGDENNISLMAADLDASLIGVLAFSRMSQAYGGLFNRLILLNSSPFSPTSLSQRPLITTIQLARTLGCPLHERDAELINCLRRKPVTQLLAAAQTLGVEDLETPFAPGLDGTIVQHDLGQMSFGADFSSLKEILGRFDLLCGLREGPILPYSYKSWGNIELDRFVSAAIKLVLKLEPGVKPSGNLKQDVIRAVRNQYGSDNPLMRELMSDFLVVNPMIQLLDAHSESGKNTFFYVSKDYDPLHKGKHSELSYVFTNKIYNWKYIDLGQPNMDLHPFEIFISLIANFVRTGDPNLSNPWDKLSTQGKTWTKYKKAQGRYLSFGREADVRSRYRRPETDFWSQVFPAILKPFLKNDWQNEVFNANPPPFFGGGGGGSGSGNRFNFTHGITPVGGSDSDQMAAGMTESSVILIGCLLLLLNVLCFMGLFYQRKRLKAQEIQLRKRFLENDDNKEQEEDATQEHRRAAAAMASDVERPRYMQSLPLDAMSEAETDNGFGPDFLGPNYDPRTKVSRWMFQQQRDSYDGQPPIPPSMPMHIDVRRPLETIVDQPNYSLLRMAPPGTILPSYAYHPYHPAASDIPYADSRATSPSVSNFQPENRIPAMNSLPRSIQYQQPIPESEAELPGSASGTLTKRQHPMVPNRSSIMIPLRNSIIIRELDDSVESSAPKLVPLKTGTLTRSVGVGSNHQDDRVNGNDNGESVPIPSTSSKHGVVQKVTFADGL